MWTQRRPHHLGYRLPAPPDPVLLPGTFFWWPATNSDRLAALEWLYATALAEARAVVRLSLPERDLAAAQN
jgi:hypothetical protein